MKLLISCLAGAVLLAGCAGYTNPNQDALDTAWSSLEYSEQVLMCTAFKTDQDQFYTYFSFAENGIDYTSATNFFKEECNG